jgi:hypothetical protein
MKERTNEHAQKAKQPILRRSYARLEQISRLEQKAFAADEHAAKAIKCTVEVLSRLPCVPSDLLASLRVLTSALTRRVVSRMACHGLTSASKCFFANGDVESGHSLLECAARRLARQDRMSKSLVARAEELEFLAIFA